jgi:pantetheine-phosphate adenylyltransferase
MKSAIYPGSFNPLHEGHLDIIQKALKVFDRVIVAKGKNPEKKNGYCTTSIKMIEALKKLDIKIVRFNTLLVDVVQEYEVDAVIRGLRNGNDLQYEINQQYLNEDLGLDIPVVYFACDRKLSHISSSAIRAVEAFKNE